MENPYEPQEPGPYAARVRAPQRRGADYHLPPIGNGHTVDAKHFRREAWTGRLMLFLFIGVPLLYILGIHYGLL